MAKPYYQDEAVTIYHGDCQEILPTIESADAVITDPPYLGARGQSWEATRVPLVVDYDPATPALLSMLARESARILSNGWLVVFQDFPGMLALREAVGAEAMMLAFAPAVWCKPTGAFTPNGTANSIAKSVDFITVARKGLAPERQRAGHYASLPYSPQAQILRTGGKPLSLMRSVILDYTEAGTTVLDPFLGAGTTLRAAKDLGRKAIGIEIEERYCEIAAKRMAQEVLPLGAAS